MPHIRSSKRWRCEGERISAVGTTAEIRALAGARTRVVDLAGRTVIPGINDAHMHPGFATAAFRIDQSMDPKREELEAAIRNAIEETPADLWILGTIGPTVLLDPTLTAETLEASARGRKVMLTGWTGHGAILSDAGDEGARRHVRPRAIRRAAGSAATRTGTSSEATRSSTRSIRSGARSPISPPTQELTDDLRQLRRLKRCRTGSRPCR